MTRDAADERGPTAADAGAGPGAPRETGPTGADAGGPHVDDTTVEAFPEVADEAAEQSADGEVLAETFPEEHDTAAETSANDDDGPYLGEDAFGYPDAYDQMRFVDVVVPLPSTNAMVLLEEISPPCRLLRIPIGLQEGAAIAYAAQDIATPKPLTHELLTSVFESFGLTVDFLRITSVRQSSFSAEIVLSGPRGSRTLACRPSDGIVLALRQRLGAPIMVAPDVLDEVGFERAPE
ncbi:MAG TPA: bifunctional nuclease family protein [Acidimicrobiales bacterium]|nr:bifunctional nuclease family protein [Acidimicrobiales bacterium]